MAATAEGKNRQILEFPKLRNICRSIPWQSRILDPAVDKAIFKAVIKDPLQDRSVSSPRLSRSVARAQSGKHEAA